MRALAAVVITLSVSQTSAHAQVGQWQQSWPPSEPAVVDLAVTSALSAWVATDDGEVRHTASGGAFWSSVQLPVNTLAAIAARSSWVCAVGDGIQNSVDNGQLWSTAVTGSVLRDVHLATSSNGWAVGDGGRVDRTIDGGANWIPSTIPGVASTLRAVHFLDANTGWVAGDAGRHFKSIDGGVNWTAVSVPGNLHFTDVFYADLQRGWLAAGDAVLFTQNGGASWTSVPVGSNVRADRISVLGGNWLWCAGTSGAIAASTNGGASWTQQFSTSGAPLLDIAMGDLFSGFAVGANGTIYRTTDGGAQWLNIAGGGGPSTDFVYDIARSGTHVWATVSNSVILRSTDDGANWTPVQAGLSQISYAAVDFFDTQHGYAVGRRFGSTPTTAWTVDGGLTWNATYWSGLYTFSDVDALAPNVAIACADNGLWRTTNGGVNWSFINTTPLSGFFGADFIDSQRGWAVGHDFLRTVDGGQSWSHLLTPSGVFRDVAFADALHGWAVGDNGAILATVDGGSNWIPQSAGPTTPSLWTVEAVSPTVVWIAGSNGFVARSTDGGSQWSPLAPLGLGTSECYGSTFAATNDGFVTSFYPVGAIWKRSPPICGATSYCVSKISSSGCMPSLQSSGTPSLSNAAGFQISTINAEHNKSGVMFVGLNGRTSTAFQGGVLCVSPPLYRLGTTNSGGAGTCQGAFAYSLADFVSQSSVGPALVPGAVVHCQTWFRDPGASNNAGLSNGLEISVCQ